MKKDTLFAHPRDSRKPFNFDAQVAEVFPDMLERSIPGYNMMLEMIRIISRRYVKPHSNCYDLGCSLGAATLAIAQASNHDSAKVIGIDNSEAMIDRCHSLISAQPGLDNVEFRLADLLDTPIDNASIVVMNFTLQFIPREERDTLISRIFQGMKANGALVLSEKIKEDEPEDDQCLIDLYHDFKGNRGYSELEIAQKRDALENVLVPESIRQHQRRLSAAGFSTVQTWFRCFNFTSLIAIK